MRLEEIDLPDAITSDAGFVCYRTNDVAYTYAVTSADSEKKTLNTFSGTATCCLSKLAHMTAISWRVRDCIARRRIASTFTTDVAAGLSGRKTCCALNCNSLFVEPERCCREFHRVVLVEERREKCKFSCRCTAGCEDSFKRRSHGLNTLTCCRAA